MLSYLSTNLYTYAQMFVVMLSWHTCSLPYIVCYIQAVDEMCINEQQILSVIPAINLKKAKAILYKG
ncbi:hypothetical protein GCM10008983_12470 [Lentibacillus halophilus]|uniref:Uncharacterized protein n=1 Tax=Lentibacillus halophilus TaxID=295065 RepID=A0ABN0Z7J0_9BACI